MSAAEKAMQDINALLDEYFSDSTRIVEVDVVMSLARIVGRYDIERVPVVDACPPRVEGAKPHCPDCSGIIGETGIVW